MGAPEAGEGASADDLEWLERETEEADLLGNHGRAAVYRRILNSLRAPVVEQEPRAWEWSTVSSDGETVYRVLTKDPDTAEQWMQDETFDGTVTPLYALAKNTGSE